MPIPSSLRRLHSERLDWAIEGYRAFLEDMDPDVRALMAGDAAHASNAVVYGPTQVGKTTLILRLLGIAEARDRPVSRVLRGGSRLGNSATATPTAYYLADDQKWHITTAAGSTIRLASDDATRHLAAMRADVQSSGPQPSGRPVRIGIPRTLARSEPSEDALATIFDLPGVDARSPHERRYVERIAPALIANADLVLMVGRADELGFAVPSRLTMEPLKEWMLAPERFRLIVTHACKPGTAQQAIRRQEITDLASARQYYSKQMTTHDYPRMIEDLQDKIYLLDFGDSLDSIADDRIVFQTAQAINEQTIALLRRDIDASTSIEQRLRLASRSHEIAVRIRRERGAEFDTAIAQARADVAHRETRLQQSRETLRLARRESSAAQRKYDGLSDIRSRANRVAVQVPAMAVPDGLSRADIRRLVDEAEDQIRAAAAASWQAVIADAELISPRLPSRSRHVDTHVRRLVQGVLNPVRDMIDEKERTLRHPIKKEHVYSKNACVTALNEQVSRCAASVQEHLRDRAERLLQPIDAALASRNAQASRRVTQAEKSLRARTKRLDAAKGAVGRLRSDRAAFDRRMQQTIDYARRYDEHMLSAFNAEMERTRQALAEAPQNRRLVPALRLLSTAETADRLEVTS